MGTPDQPRTPAGSPDGGQFGCSAGAESTTTLTDHAANLRSVLNNEGTATAAALQDFLLEIAPSLMDGITVTCAASLTINGDGTVDNNLNVALHAEPHVTEVNRIIVDMITRQIIERHNTKH